MSLILTAFSPYSHTCSLPYLLLQSMMIMNAQVNMPQLQKIIQEFMKQSEMMEMKTEVSATWLLSIVAFGSLVRFVR